MNGPLPLLAQASAGPPAPAGASAIHSAYAAEESSEGAHRPPPCSARSAAAGRLPSPHSTSQLGPHERPGRQPGAIVARLILSGTVGLAPVASMGERPVERHDQPDRAGHAGLAPAAPGSARVIQPSRTLEERLRVVRGQQPAPQACSRRSSGRWPVPRAAAGAGLPPGLARPGARPETAPWARSGPESAQLLTHHRHGRCWRSAAAPRRTRGAKPSSANAGHVVGKRQSHDSAPGEAPPMYTFRGSRRLWRRRPAPPATLSNHDDRIGAPRFAGARVRDAATMFTGGSRPNGPGARGPASASSPWPSAQLGVRAGERQAR